MLTTHAKKALYILIAVLSINISSANNLKHGLLVHLPVDTLMDISGNNLHAKAATDIHSVQITIPDHQSINLGMLPKRTISFWFKIHKPHIDETQVLYSEGNDARGLNIYYHRQKLYVKGWNRPTNESGWEGNYIKTSLGRLGQSHHILVTLDGAQSVKSDALKLYVDGRLKGSAPGSILWPHNTITLGGVNGVTRLHTGSSNKKHIFQGAIKDFRIYNKILSRCEISAMLEPNVPCAPDKIQRLILKKATTGNKLGKALAMSHDYAVASTHPDKKQSGKIHVFERNMTKNQWQQMATLKDNNNDPLDQYGSSADIADDVIVIGAPEDSEKERKTGAVYIYERNLDSNIWQSVERITPPEGKDGDKFGHSVSVLNDILFVGAPGDDGKAEDAGAVYVYKRDDKTQQWLPVTKLTASDTKAKDYFGHSLDFDGQSAIIGIERPGKYTGAAYIFTQQGEQSTWQEQQKLVSDEPDYKDAYGYGDTFGYSVAISGRVAIVGAYRDDTNTRDSGAVYVFIQDQQSKEWLNHQKIVEKDTHFSDFFGKQVSLSGKYLIVGAEGFNRDPDTTNIGKVYIYQLGQKNKWNLINKLIDVVEKEALFGSQISISTQGAMLATPGYSNPKNEEQKQIGSITYIPNSLLTGVDKTKQTEEDRPPPRR